jgi:hypothetical protein
MLPDVCFRLGDNSKEGADGNPNIGGGALSTGEIVNGGISYGGNLGSGGCVGKPVLSTMAQMETTFVVAFQDEKGDPIDLTNTDEVVFIAREMTYLDKRYIDKACTIDPDPTLGKVTLTLTLDDTKYAGLWEAGFQLLGVDSAVQAEFRIYLELQKGMHYELSSWNDPITIGEVRMALFDRCPQDNEFLDDVEFKDTEIIYAIRRIVDLWNEEKPVIAGAIYTMATFPYRYHGVNAACGELMRMRGIQLMRNSMPINTGSGRIDDKERANPYIKIGEEMINSYRQWMRTEKSRINSNNVFGGTSRPQGALYGYPRNSR